MSTVSGSGSSDRRRVGPYAVPRVLISDECLEHISRQLFSVRHRYLPDPMFPGWTLKDTNAADRTVLRYDDDNGDFWLYVLTGQRSPDGFYQVAEWRD